MDTTTRDGRSTSPVDTIMSDATPPSFVHTAPPTLPPRKPSRIRFKSVDPQSSNSSSHIHSSSSRPHRHHHRSQRRQSGPRERSVSPNTAFRESLFDALADDEGAAFWEGVYGQPIHNYSYNKKNPDGKLERMTDEEYVAYVRGKMWEKTHGYIVEEMRRRAEQRKHRKKREEERKMWDKGVGEALKRGEERRRKGKWKACWEGYISGWESPVETKISGKILRDQMVWPVESGKWEDVRREEVERFFKNAPQPTTITTGEPSVVDLRAVLKAERVRWHPDKIQQRFRGQGIDVDESTLKIVTAVFQVIDRMWSETRPGAEGGT